MYSILRVDGCSHAVQPARPCARSFARSSLLRLRMCLTDACAVAERHCAVISSASAVSISSLISSLSLFTVILQSPVASRFISLLALLGSRPFNLHLPLSCSLSYSLVSSHLGALASVCGFLPLHHIITVRLRLPCACCSLTTLRLPSARQKLVGSRDHSSSLLSSGRSAASRHSRCSQSCAHTARSPLLFVSLDVGPLVTSVVVGRVSDTLMPLLDVARCLRLCSTLPGKPHDRFRATTLIIVLGEKDGLGGIRICIRSRSAGLVKSDAGGGTAAKSLVASTFAAATLATGTAAEGARFAVVGGAWDAALKG